MQHSQFGGNRVAQPIDKFTHLPPRFMDHRHVKTSSQMPSSEPPSADLPSANPPSANPPHVNPPLSSYPNNPSAPAQPSPTLQSAPSSSHYHTQPPYCLPSIRNDPRFVPQPYFSTPNSMHFTHHAYPSAVSAPPSQWHQPIPCASLPSRNPWPPIQTNPAVSAPFSDATLPPLIAHPPTHNMTTPQQHYHARPATLQSPQIGLQFPNEALPQQTYQRPLPMMFTSHGSLPMQGEPSAKPGPIQSEEMPDVGGLNTSRALVIHCNAPGALHEPTLGTTTGPRCGTENKGAQIAGKHGQKSGCEKGAPSNQDGSNGTPVPGRCADTDWKKEKLPVAAAHTAFPKDVGGASSLLYSFAHSHSQAEPKTEGSAIQTTIAVCQDPQPPAQTSGMSTTDIVKSATKGANGVHGAVVSQKNGMEKAAPARSGSRREGERAASRRRQPTAEDALDYYQILKSHFSGEPSVYKDFLDIVREFKEGGSDTKEFILRVFNLLLEHEDLVLGLNAFLPSDYEIEVTEDADTGVLHTGLHGPKGLFTWLSKDAEQPEVAPPAHNDAPALSHGAEPATKESAQAALPEAIRERIHSAFKDSAKLSLSDIRKETNQHNKKTSQSSHKDGVRTRTTEAKAKEFERVLQFVSQIKERLSGAPDTFNRFSDVLRKFRQEQKSIREVFETVADLCGTHDDLLSIFKGFIPEIAFNGIQDTSAVEGDRPAQLSRSSQDSKPIAKNGPDRTVKPLDCKKIVLRFAKCSQLFEYLKSHFGPNKAHLTTECIRCITCYKADVFSKQETILMMQKILGGEQDALAPVLAYLESTAGAEDTSSLPEKRAQKSSSTSSKEERLKSTRIMKQTLEEDIREMSPGGRAVLDESGGFSAPNGDCERHDTEKKDTKNSSTCAVGEGDKTSGKQKSPKKRKAPAAHRMSLRKKQKN